MMIGDPKPIASLSSGLLARKGQARPAMRPQSFSSFHSGFAHDDLGWNDMGHDAPMPVSFRDATAPEDVPPVLVQRQELVEQIVGPGVADGFVDNEPDMPLLRKKPRDQVKSIADAASPAPATPHPEKGRKTNRSAKAQASAAKALPLPTVAISRARKAAKGRTGKAAFTLRLDADRHLRLRLACAIARKSAQVLVCEALDSYLAGVPEVETLVGKLPTGRAG